MFVIPSCVTVAVAPCAPYAASPEPDAADADALLVARLAWDTPGSSPGLPTLTTIDVFETPDCAALASACASCWTDASPAFSTAADVDAAASAAARFSWPTGVPSPGSSTCTAIDVLSTSLCSAEADASASCDTEVPRSTLAPPPGASRPHGPAHWPNFPARQPH